MTTDLTSVQGSVRGAPVRSDGIHTLARGLGLFSIALGLVELLQPRRIAKVAEVGRGPGRPDPPASTAVVRAFGVRELGTGAGLLTTDNPEPWMWGRVAGDVVDLAAVALSPRRRTLFGRPEGSRTGALVALAALTALDVYCANALRREREAREASPHDWSGRSGFAQSAETMRGAAADFDAPADMRTPEALRPWTNRVRAGTVVQLPSKSEPNAE